MFISSNALAQLDLLEKAYEKKSIILLDSFITNWAKEVPAITDEQLSFQDDTIKAIYDLFNLNFDPQNISKLIDSAHYKLSDSIYKNIQFAIIPAEMNFSLVDEFLSDTWLANPKFKDRFKNNKDTVRVIRNLEAAYGFSDSLIFKSDINFFRPQYKNDIKILYLNTKYDSILNMFIFNVNGTYLTKRLADNVREDINLLFDVGSFALVHNKK